MSMILNFIQISKPLLILVLLMNCSARPKSQLQTTSPQVGQNESDSVKVKLDTLVKAKRIYFAKKIAPGAHQTDLYINELKGKSIALVVNQTSRIGEVHLVDSLLRLGLKIKTIFAPEHGFRGDHSAGAHVASGKDKKTGLPIISLYGNHKKPTSTDLKEIDYVVFDIQDVGTRFYTYLSTMHYVMESCAEENIPFMILDRPNPNGFYVDGPILDPKFKSFVGMHPIPIVHGMTLGELAKMINGEGWLNNKVQTQLKVIAVENYHHNRIYTLPVKPSPNLPTKASIYLYPSLCLFEGTDVSVGRGTDKPFECFGRPGLEGRKYTFTPKSIPGVAANPPHKGVECSGALLTSFGLNYLPNSQRLYLDWLILCYAESKKNNSKMFNSFFDKLAGTDELRKQIIAGKSQDEIYLSWENDLKAFKTLRAPYLLYGYKEKGGIFE